MRELLAENPVVPVIVIEKIEDAVPLAQSLLAGGIRLLEVTLRSDAALPGIREIARQVPQAVVGAGTVCSVEQIKQCEDAGCKFLISPGFTPRLLDAAEKSSIPFLPGIASVSEMMLCAEYGHRDFKFFPAQAAGGAPLLKSIHGPFPGMRFCPTGGISTSNVMEYLSLPNVLCVGGSWLAPAELIRQKRWDEIERLARQACALRS